MTRYEHFTIHRLTQGKAAKLTALNNLFGQVFAQPDIYSAHPPDAAWLDSLLADPGFICLTAETRSGQIIGGLCGYILKKFEQQRTELFVYDLAVDAAWHRQGIATALFDYLKPLARSAGAWVIVVTADHDNEAAVALYRKLGVEERTLHYDIAP